jgi:hypothetical protein
MDWQLAITRNREALTAIIMALIKSLGVAGLTSPLRGEAVRRTGEGLSAYTLSLHIYSRALAILRPAESAVRRLIMIAALQLAPSKFCLRKPSARQVNFALLPQRQETKIPAFTLIDPLKTFGEETPGFEVLGTSYHQSLHDHSTPPTTSHICALTLSRRLLALKHALDTLPKQAKRLARWYAVRDAALKQMQPHRLSPMRPGTPVGLPKSKRSEVQEVLLECHLLAVYARDQHDSS